MHVDVIEGIQLFAKLRANWDAVYEADPEAQFFLSATWMSDWLARLGGPWFILAAKPNAAETDYVAFFPLRLRTKERKGGIFYNEINMAGNYAADYTGFICRPEWQNDAVPALAKQLRRLNWTHLRLDNFCASDGRLQLFLSYFSQRTFDTEELVRINKADNIDNCICPFTKLPGTWDAYLADSLSANMRQKIRRFLRQVETGDEFRITLSGADTVDRDVRILLRFWAAKWGARKGERLQNLLRTNFATLMRAFANGSLFLPILWKGEVPLAALASFIDPMKKAVLFYVGGRDETVNTPPPGLVLHAYSIRYAIAHGMATYDFLRGNEPYKYMFGAQERHIKCIRVSTRTRRNLGDRIDKRSLPAVLRRATELHQSGKLAEAELGYRQVLAVTPQDPQTLYRLGQLLATKGNHAAAKKTFKVLVAVKPESYKAWLGLARALHARHRFAEAEKAYRAVVALRPESAPAHGNLGHILAGLGRYREAIAAFETALGLQPDDINARSGLTHALERARGMAADQQEGPQHPKCYGGSNAVAHRRPVGTMLQ
jgi:tetratricopeptide (TPR) repeat protein